MFAKFAELLAQCGQETTVSLYLSPPVSEREGNEHPHSENLGEVRTYIVIDNVAPTRAGK